MILALGLALVLASIEDLPDCLLAGGMVSETLSRSWVVRGFRQPSLWIRDS